MTRQKLAPDRTNAVACLRVSTDRQDLGPDAQRESIRRWARARGVTIIGWHEDRGISGGADMDSRHRSRTKYS